MSPEAEAIVRAADMCDTMAARTERHEAVTWEYGNDLLNMLEQHARLIARLLRAEAVKMQRSEIPLAPRDRSFT